MKILNFGSLNIDSVYEVAKIVLEGETIISKNYASFCGGKGLNQSIAFSRTGKTVYHAGMVGVDGQILVDELKKNNVDTSFLKFSTQKSGHSIIQVDEEGHNCIICYGGANHLIDKSYVDFVLSNFEKGDYLILQNELSNADYMIDRGSELGMKIIFNPSPITKEIFDYSLDKVHVLILNEIEGKALSEIDSDDELKVLERLSEKFPKTKIVLTLGSDGCYYKFCDEIVKQDCFQVPVVDTTAAGDTFTGYFIYSLVENLSVKEGLKLASAASALAISKRGAAVSIPTLDEVLKFIG